MSIADHETAAAAPARPDASDGSDASTGATRRGIPAPRVWAVPVALTLACLAVTLAHLRMPSPSDQMNYFWTAARFPGPFQGATELHQVTRWGLIVPAHLAIAVFGSSQAAYYTVPIIGTLALLLGTYAVGTLLFSRLVGAAAAVVVVTATPVFADATELLPDVLATGIFTIALAMTVAIRQGRLAAHRPALITIGLLLGWSYLVREFIVFVWPLIPVLLHRRVNRAAALWIAAPMALLFLIELGLCQALYGDPLTRLHAIAGHGQGPSTPRIAASFRDKPRQVYIMRLPHQLRTYTGGPWLVALLASTLAGGLLWRRRLAVPVLWCALLWTPLTLLGGVLDPSRPKLRLQLIRYWFPIFPAFVIGGLGTLWLAGLWAGRWARAAGPARPRAAGALSAALVTAVATGATGSAVAGWWAAPGTRLGGATQLEALRSWMSVHGAGRRLWADRYTAKMLTVYETGPFGGRIRWPRMMRADADLPGPVDPGAPYPPGTPGMPGAVTGMLPGDLVLFFDTERGTLCGACRLRERQLWGSPPRPLPGWRTEFTTDDGVVRVYSVAPPSAPAITAGGSGRAEAGTATLKAGIATSENRAH